MVLQHNEKTTFHIGESYFNVSSYIKYLIGRMFLNFQLALCWIYIEQKSSQNTVNELFKHKIRATCSTQHP